MSADRHLASGDLIRDRTARRVRLSAQELLLTPKAVAILAYLMTHPDALIPREWLVGVISTMLAFGIYTTRAAWLPPLRLSTPPPAQFSKQVIE